MYLCVVRRGADALRARLTCALAHDPAVEIIVDRRFGIVGGLRSRRLWSAATASAVVKRAVVAQLAAAGWRAGH